MKTQNTNPLVSTSVVPAVPPATAPVVPGGFTLGLDLGDRRHFVCALDAAGTVIQEGFLANSRPCPEPQMEQQCRGTAPRMLPRWAGGWFADICVLPRTQSFRSGHQIFIS